MDPIDEKLHLIAESYQAQVRGTPLVRMPVFDGLYGKRVWLKDESDLSKHPTGTFKDRRNAELIAHILQDPILRGKRILLTTITYGNSGESLEFWVSRAHQDLQREGLSDIAPDLIAVSIVDTNSCLSLGQKPSCYRLEVDLSARLYDLEEIKHDALAFVSKQGNNVDRSLHTERTVWSSSNNFHAAFFQYNLSYATIGDEISTALDKGITVACPVGNGELFWALRNSKAAKTRMSIVGGTIGQNPFGRKILSEVSGDYPSLWNAQDLDSLVQAYYQSLRGCGNKKDIQQKVQRFRYHAQAYTLGFCFARGVIEIRPDDPFEFHPDKQTSYADKLVCPHSIYAQDKIEMSYLYREAMILAGEKDIKEEHRLWQRLNVRCEPSAAVAGVAARVLYKFTQNDADRLDTLFNQQLHNWYKAKRACDDVVIINTGRGVGYQD